MCHDMFSLWLEEDGCRIDNLSRGHKWHMGAIWPLCIIFFLWFAGSPPPKNFCSYCRIFQASCSSPSNFISEITRFYQSCHHLEMHCNCAIFEVFQSPKDVPEILRTSSISSHSHYWYFSEETWEIVQYLTMISRSSEGHRKTKCILAVISVRGRQEDVQCCNPTAIISFVTTIK